MADTLRICYQSVANYAGKKIDHFIQKWESFPCTMIWLTIIKLIYFKYFYIELDVKDIDRENLWWQTKYRLMITERIQTDDNINSINWWLQTQYRLMMADTI